MRFHLANKRIYPWIFAIGCVALLPSAYFIPKSYLPDDRRFEALLAILAAVGAFTHFLYSRHIEETRLFKELFSDFNKRYDKINNKLNKILSNRDSEKLNDTEKQILYDYFNLCAEEYLFFKSNFIHREVWDSWRNGMLTFASDSRIKNLWKEEINSGSYYGFHLGLIELNKFENSKKWKFVATCVLFSLLSISLSYFAAFHILIWKYPRITVSEYYAILSLYSVPVITFVTLFWIDCCTKKFGALKKITFFLVFIALTYIGLNQFSTMKTAAMLGSSSFYCCIFLLVILMLNPVLKIVSQKLSKMVEIYSSFEIFKIIQFVLLTLAFVLHMLTW